MQVKQIYELMNAVTGEILGENEILQEDLQGVIDLGKAVFDATSVDNYVKTLMDQVGKIVFVNRAYTGKAPSVLMDGWEFGSVLEKVQCELPEASENESWELEDGQSYDPNIFYKPTVSAKFYNSKVTFEVDISITDRQVKESFQSAQQLNSFLSMIFNAVEKSMSIKIASLIKRTVNNMIAEVVYAEYDDAAYTTKSGVRARNLLKEFNDLNDTNLTADKCLQDSSFLAYASAEMKLVIGYIGELSEVYNVGGKPRFTPKELLHVQMLEKFMASCDTYLQSNTFHNEFTALPKGETVSYWQAPGNAGFKFADVSKIKVVSSANHTVELGGILCVMFDRDALGVANFNRRVTSKYNPKAEFTNNFYKMDAGYFNDLDENFVVFFVA